MATMTYPPPPGPPPAFAQYAPPPGPRPQMYAPPPGPLPQLHAPLECQTADDLAFALFSASSAYFALPADPPEKTKYAAPSGVGVSDEGFADLLGEKALITIRRTGPAGTPAPLRDATSAAWHATGEVFLSAVRDVAEGLELPGLDAFDEMTWGAEGSELAAIDAVRAPLVRPDSASDEGKGKRVVAETHKDLGILTLVVGASPGLDPCDAAGSHPSRGPIAHLPHGLFAAGTHRVSVLPPPSSSPEDVYRYSVVFARRPATACRISTSTFSTSPLVPAFPDALPESTKAASRRAHARDLGPALDVNVAGELREEQKRKLGIGAGGGERAGAGGAGAGGEKEGERAGEEGNKQGEEGKGKDEDEVALGAESRLG
ncbi:hypothetical protein C8R45DRAFT_1077075 [Mycena sanguinolenta]|nr:hypothetical protein C8R45DRAFT_1077075 [Mycena sanguinolenta]